MSFLGSITPFIVAAAYVLFLLGYLLYSVYAIHHLNEFGYSGDASQTMLRFYIGFTGLILIATATTVTVGFFTL